MLALLQETEDYVPVQELMNAFHISKRTVYYDMSKINDWLRDNRLPPVEYVRGTGFLLPEKSRKQLPVKAKEIQPNHYYLSRNERKAWLGLHLISRAKPMFLHDMEQLLQVSRGTAHSELKALREELAGFGLHVKFQRKQGYTVQGNEKDQRTALSHFLSELLSHISWKDFVSQVQGLVNANLYKSHIPSFREEQLSAVYDIIASGERTIGMELTDETIVELAVRLIFYTNRIIQGKTVSMDRDEREALQATPQFKAALDISQKLGELFEIQLPEDEACYITVHLLAAKVNKMEDESDDLETMRLRKATGRMIDTFERLGCVYFQQREALEKQLFLHVKSAYYRIKYGLAKENPLTDTMKDKYREIFELTKKSVHPLQELLHKPIDEHEIAYLSMHFGGWLRREQTEPAPRKSAAIVCVNGVSASRILKIQLEQLFPAVDIEAILSLRDYEAFDKPVDFIFSTVPLTGANAPVFIVNAILSDTEKAHLLNQVHPYLDGGNAMPGPSAQTIVDIVKKHATIGDENDLHEDIQRYLTAARTQTPEDRKPALQDLLPLSRIAAVDKAEDWRSAIRLAAEPLLNEGCIIRPYVQAMIGKIEERGPYIVVAPGVAIAHARPEDGVVRVSMALLCIRRGVAFGSDPKHRVCLLFVLASSDGETHLKALSQLTAMLREDKNRDRLANAADESEIFRMIRQYSTTS